MRRGILVTLLLLSTVVVAAPGPTSPRISALAAKLAKHERGAEDLFWGQIAKEGGPIVEPSTADNLLVTLVWRGNSKTQRVAMFGPFRTVKAELARLPGSNVFYVTVELPATTRFTYSYFVDGEIEDSNPIPHGDPFNQRMFTPTVSWLALPKAPAQPSIVLHRGTQTGELTLHTLDKRKIYVYTPPGYTPKGPTYPLVVAFDADTAITFMPMPEILDELIASKQIPPVVAVLVGNVDRMVDLQSDGFTDMVALDLVPWMRANYHATSDPRRTVITGVSLGGLASAMTALHHPDVIGNVLSQSGSFWRAPQGEEPEDTARWLATAPHVPVRFWLEVGLFEAGPPDQPTSMLAANRHLRDVLNARGNEVMYSEFAGDHTYLQWRGSIAGGLISLLATSPKTTERPAKPSKRTPLPISAGTPTPISQLARAACVDGGDAALAAAKKVDASEEEVDTAAFAVVFLEHEHDALPLLRWNTERFPKSRNAWDSYAWMQFGTGDRKGARASFQKKLELAPDDVIAKRMLSVL